MTNQPCIHCKLELKEIRRKLSEYLDQAQYSSPEFICVHEDCPFYLNPKKIYPWRIQVQEMTVKK